MNPVEKIRKRLERIISTTSDAIKNDFDNKYYLESILRKLEKEINNSEAKIENLINLTNDEEETLKKTITDSPSKVSDESKDNESLANSLLNEKDFEIPSNSLEAQ